MKKIVVDKKIIKETIKNIIALILIITSNIILCFSYYVLKILKDVNFYEYVYLWNSDSSGSGGGIILSGIEACLLIFIILQIVFLIPIIKPKNIKLTLKIKLKRKEKTIKLFPTILNKYKISYSILIFLLSFFIVTKVIKVDEYYENIKQKTYIYETYYKDAKNVKLTFPEKKKNLILLFLESTESSLFSKANGGAFEESIIPELESLALNNINFSNTSLLGGGYNLSSTSWTLASSVAASSGTPILANFENDYSKIKKFMPNIKTLGDVLKEQGYNLELIQGTNANFSGINKYFKTHGNHKIFDYKTAIEKGYISEDYFEWWGIEDKKLFKYAKKEIEELNSKNTPFAVTLFTMDTHFKDGYLDSSCKEKYDKQLSNVYACSSKMVNEFIEWIKSQDFYKDTVIVILGDHLTMQGEYYDGFESYKRTIYNSFINTEEKPINNKNREFSSLDMYPTILASLGVKIEGNTLGFGVNLFSEQKTLIEELGYEKFDEELSKSSDYYNKNIFSEKQINRENENYDIIN